MHGSFVKRADITIAAISRPTPLIAVVFVGGMSAVKILQPKGGAMCCTFFIIEQKASWW